MNSDVMTDVILVMGILMSREKGTLLPQFWCTTRMCFEKILRFLEKILKISRFLKKSKDAQKTLVTSYPNVLTLNFTTFS